MLYDEEVGLLLKSPSTKRAVFVDELQKFRLPSMKTEDFVDGNEDITKMRGIAEGSERDRDMIPLNVIQSLKIAGQAGNDETNSRQ